MAETKSKLLIIEDDLDIAEMLNAYFRVQGYDVFTVNWGEDGVRACQTHRPDLVILDIRLPDIDGFEVARRLRADRRTQDVPIIFLTEKRDRADRLQGLEAGAEAYLTKPFDVQELRLRVQNVLQRARRIAPTNPITGLPEGAAVDERLTECLHTEDWAILVIGIENLETFREAYGFVASDDVLRAMSLMIQNALREVGESGHFVGHLGPCAFVLITSQSALPALEERLRSRLEQSLEYFYPLKDREQERRNHRRLKLRFGVLQGGAGQYETLEHLKRALMPA
jgi:DNA-binding response OmpR family regulator